MTEKEIDIKAVNAFGVKYGANQVFLLNGQFQFYIKKGDKSSKHYLYILKKSMRKQQKIAWEVSNTTCMDRVVKFWTQIGKKAELINIDYSSVKNQE